MLEFDVTRKLSSGKPDGRSFFFCPYYSVSLPDQSARMYFTYAEHVRHFIVQKAAIQKRESHQVATAYLPNSTSLSDSLQRNIERPDDVQAAVTFIGKAPDFLSKFYGFAGKTISDLEQDGIVSLHAAVERLNIIGTDCVSILENLQDFLMKTSPDQLRHKLELYGATEHYQGELIRLAKLERLVEEIQMDLRRFRDTRSPIDSEAKEPSVIDNRLHWASDFFHRCNQENQGEFRWEDLVELLDVEKMPKASMIERDESRRIEALLYKAHQYKVIDERLARYERMGELFNFWEALSSFVGMPWPDEVERPKAFYELVERLQRAFDETTNEITLLDPMNGRLD